ncbi:hypothetical protein [Romboutsia sp.]|uniref:hypothetical protein n=1 Tax=Romboutsia sp. TaxID=1965302 RepID=UPI003F2C1D0B
MKKLLKKSYVILIAAFIGIFTLAACTNKDDVKSRGSSLGSSADINEDSAKAISIENEEIVNISTSNENKIDIATRIENTSNFDISNILINYEEYDKNKNVISKSQSFLDITLNPNESAHIGFSHVKYADSIKIISYTYILANKSVFVDLKNDSVSITKNSAKIEDSKSYEILAMEEPYKKDDSSNLNNYKIKIKNTSSKNIGNITLKIGELNENGEYITATDISEYDILKPKEDMEIEIPVSQHAKKIELIGYSYDDVKENSNVKVDIKTHKVEINK